MPLHYSLGNRVRLHLKNENNILIVCLISLLFSDKGLVVKPAAPNQAQCSQGLLQAMEVGLPSMSVSIQSQDVHSQACHSPKCVLIRVRKTACIPVKDGWWWWLVGVGITSQTKQSQDC